MGAGRLGPAARRDYLPCLTGIAQSVNRALRFIEFQYGADTTMAKCPQRAMRRELRNVDSVDVLCEMLRVPKSYLLGLIYGRPATELYTSFEIPKSTGGTRLIHAPIPPLKNLQRRLLSYLEALYHPFPASQGFIKGRGIVGNAQRHIRRRHVLNLDLKSFFPSITFPRVYGMFLNRPYSFPRPVAAVLAQLCCRNGELAQGAPTSPMISNMICARLDGGPAEFERRNAPKGTKILSMAR